MTTRGTAVGGSESGMKTSAKGGNASGGAGGGCGLPLGLVGLPGLALVSSVEAHRKDLRYLTVTRATCEADVDFVLKGN